MQQTIQQQAKQYLEKHSIEEILADLINTLTNLKMDNPIIYMIKYLAQMHCTPEQLTNAGIVIPSDDMPRPFLCLTFPQLKDHKGHIKKCLQREQFYSCKNNFTTYGNSFRTVLKLILENPQSKVGLFAVDPDCYQVYEPLFDSILKQHFNWNGVPYTKDHSFAVKTTILEDVRPYLEESVFTMRRNINRNRFNGSMTSEARQQLTKHLQNILSKQQICQYTNTYNLGDMINDEFKKLYINDRLVKRREMNTQTIGNLYKNARFPDWPQNRVLLQSNDKNSMVWINREDHLKFKFLATDKPSFVDQLKKCLQMNDYLEQHNLSFHEKYGYQTVKPQCSGLGISFTLKYKLDSQLMQKVKNNWNNNFANKQNNQKNLISSQIKDNKYLLIQFNKGVGTTVAQIVEQLSQTLTVLFEGAIQAKEIPIKMQIEEESDYLLEHQKRLQQVIKNSHPKKLIDIANSIQFDGIYHIPQVVHNKFIIVRRNLLKRNVNLEELLKFVDNPTIVGTEILKKANLPIKECLIYEFSTYHLILNYDDDLMWIFDCDEQQISQKLAEISLIVDQFDLKGQKIAYSNDLGYLTNNNEHIGSGLSIVFQLQCQDKLISRELAQNPSSQKDQILATGQYLILRNVNDKSYQVYRILMNDILVELKKAIQKSEVIDNQLTSLDCYQHDILWLPRLTCLVQYNSLYTQYMKEKVVLKLRDPLPQLYDKKGKIESITNIVDKMQLRITCTLSRNFQNYKYPHDLTFVEKTQLTNKLNDRVQLNNQGNKWAANCRFNINQVHHLQIVFSTSVNEFIQQFRQASDWLDKLTNDDLKYQYDPNFGFLGANLNETLLDGFQLEISVKVKQLNDKICMDYDYLLEERNNKMLLRSQRPCALNVERTFIQRLMENYQ